MARQRAHSRSQKGSRTGVKVPNERQNVGDDGFEDPSTFFASAISPSASTNSTNIGSTSKYLNIENGNAEAESSVNTLQPRKKKTIRFSNANDIVGFVQDSSVADSNNITSPTITTNFEKNYAHVTRKLAENILKVRKGRNSIDTMDLSTVSTAPPSQTKLSNSVSHDDSPETANTVEHDIIEANVSDADETSTHLNLIVLPQSRSIVVVRNN
jgi:hypothetical protein